ncbi:protein cycle isoform X2 [Leptidea sinapis]|uniref:protein cycle isoform X2 n=1 Tax=Leptidea sinapis TaxID=189913 RepID=UPI00212E6644|nr:protein cycle isoform X2 [Leptidea sinapis]XP_050682991.1 protein cycle isoform X2 [Leptidea sinapis]
MTRCSNIRSNVGPVAGFEVTTGGGDMASGAGVSVQTGDAHAPLSMSHQAAEDPHKMRGPHFTDSYEMENCEVPLSGPSAPLCNSATTPSPNPASATRKRKPSSYSANTYEDRCSEDSRSTRNTLPDKKQNHSEIEKRRRDKMNTYISELSTMIPMCGAMARKLDKLTVLRLAVQHLRTVRGAISAGPLTARPRPAFLSEQELNALVLRAASDCFLLVVGCDRGRILYISASVMQMLHYDQTELLGQSLFDILHPKDVSKVKEQLSAVELSPRERLIDAKTMMPVKTDLVSGASRLCTGARRSFSCRIKCRNLPRNDVKDEEGGPTTTRKPERKYNVVQCTGYLKSWAPAEMCEGGTSSGPSSLCGEGSVEDDTCNMSCLVAVVRALPSMLSSDRVPASPATCASEPPTRQLMFISRHAPDGKFLFVDQRVTLALGFLPQELLGTSMYEYVSGLELGVVARTHKAALLRLAPTRTTPYCFRRKDGIYARLITHFKPFKNPWTKEVESLVANNIVLSSIADPQPDVFGSQTYKNHSVSATDMPQREEPELTEADVEMQRLIDSQVESHKVGSAIAEVALRRSSTEFSPDLPVDLLQDALFNQQANLVDNILGSDIHGYSEVRNNVSLSAAGADASPELTEVGGAATNTPPPASPPLPIDGNGEAAMAVIMSLLEADAGLGGPVNFSGLPWPLP